MPEPEKTDRDIMTSLAAREITDFAGKACDKYKLTDLEYLHILASMMQSCLKFALRDQKPKRP